jgi:hypothetical protein
MTLASASGVTHVVKSACGMSLRFAGVSIMEGSTAFTVMPSFLSSAWSPNGDYGVDSLCGDLRAVIGGTRRQAGSRRCFVGRQHRHDHGGRDAGNRTRLGAGGCGSAPGIRGYSAHRRLHDFATSGVCHAGRGGGCRGGLQSVAAAAIQQPGFGQEPAPRRGWTLALALGSVLHANGCNPSCGSGRGTAQAHGCRRARHSNSDVADSRCGERCGEPRRSEERCRRKFLTSKPRMWAERGTWWRVIATILSMPRC